MCLCAQYASPGAFINFAIDFRFVLVTLLLKFPTPQNDQIVLLLVSLAFFSYPSAVVDNSCKNGASLVIFRLPLSTQPKHPFALFEKKKRKKKIERHTFVGQLAHIIVMAYWFPWIIILLSTRDRSDYYYIKPTQHIRHRLRHASIMFSWLLFLHHNQCHRWSLPYSLGFNILVCHPEYIYIYIYLKTIHRHSVDLIITLLAGIFIFIHQKSSNWNIESRIICGCLAKLEIAKQLETRDGKAYNLNGMFHIGFNISHRKYNCFSILFTIHKHTNMSVNFGFVCVFVARIHKCYTWQARIHRH